MVFPTSGGCLFLRVPIVCGIEGKPKGNPKSILTLHPFTRHTQVTSLGCGSKDGARNGSLANGTTKTCIILALEFWATPKWVPFFIVSNGNQLDNHRVFFWGGSPTQRRKRMVVPSRHAKNSGSIFLEPRLPFTLWTGKGCLRHPGTSLGKEKLRASP